MKVFFRPLFNRITLDKFRTLVPDLPVFLFFFSKCPMSMPVPVPQEVAWADLSFMIEFVLSVLGGEGERKKVQL
jgi:hypothetical protein